MSTKFKTVITTAGAAKLAAATAPGGRKVNITTMAVGDGGGKLPVPDAGQTKLVNEVWRHTLNKISQDNRHSNYIIAELVIPPEVGGFWMRELGLYDDAGTLIAVANMAESYKPALAEGSGRSQTCRMVIIVSSVASVELTIDTTTVMATQDYVDDKIAEHEQSRRHPDASLTAKGFTQLSSATNSTSETLAATPKAVKAVMDETNKKAPLSSPALTGTPTAPTAPKGTNNTQIANTAFVMAAIAALVDSSPDALNTLNELAAALGNDPNFATTMTNALAGKQPKDATLTALAGLATAADRFPYFTGNDTASLATLTKVGRDILAKATVAAVIEYLGLQETVELAAGAVPATRKVNGRALTSDINVTSQDIFNGQSISIGANQNLNDYMTPGLYHQSLNANTSSALNYPENNAGNLIVLKNAGVKQIYHVYNSSRVWSRSKYSSEPWTPWAREYNSQSKPTPAELAVLALAGGSMSGSIKFINDAFLIWERNTDWAKIGFKNDSDSDTDSYLWFETGDNGNEYFKWRTRVGSATKDLMFLKSDALRVTGQVIPANYGNFDSRYQAKNTASKAANGWHKDASTGIITQWGYISNAGAGLTFPVAFPSACASITITNAHGRFDYSIAVNSLSRTGAKFNSEGNGNMYWTAIGY
ncbi:phage tail protein [Escherichia marmotae]|jgi:phage-related tail fiber protein|uniref:phage tail-collar fiber domain-containing protein n=1 Tax=Escherichia TaxID=561 RepID=UPI0021D50554|nr:MULTISPECIES: phage tail protein [Escherichia]MCU7295069.1 phage tail protein [Escherichia albertii]MCZ9152652.1 phage tail protein [Escherichia albertii]MCZ9162366.1 phage tail protein [Escherichia albertii]MCZ9165377.1 phage tail protein [Escherichia albertii]MCZ9221774.1 phage tail protein [Escherichia albertii]